MSPKEALEKNAADTATARSNKAWGVCACVAFVLSAPLLLAAWLGSVGVMARAWHWMLGGF